MTACTKGFSSPWRHTSDHVHIKTPMHQPSEYDALAQLHPMRRIGDVADVVEAALYLGVGRDAVAAYYDAQPSGMTVDYHILESRHPASGVVLGYLDALFSYPDRDPVRVNIDVVLTRHADHWQVLQYQASGVR